MSDVETRAREMGWKPKDQFKGPEEKWVDADEYVRRGEEVLPIVRGENRKLHEKVGGLEAEIARLTAALAEQSDSMKSFAEGQAALLKEKLAEQRANLRQQLREARESGDDAAIDRLEEALETNREASRKAAAPAPAPAPAAPAEPPVPPEVKAWQERNPWFNGASRLDKAKTGAAMQFAAEAAAKGLKGESFLTYVDEAMAEVYPPTAPTNKTEDGGPTGGGSGARGGAFSKLPPEAQAKAREQSRLYVGPNKMFKTEDEWFKYYTKQYEEA